MLSPALLQKLVTAEPDAMVSGLLFAGFVIWWDGHNAGRIRLVRWIAIGLVLAAAGMTKGPQPVAYFTLGVGAFLVFRRQWPELPGLVLAHGLAGIPLLVWYIAIYQPGDLAIWQAQGRLNAWFGPLEWFTGLAHYIAQVALFHDRGARYAMPAVLAVAALAGLGFERFRGQRPWLTNVGVASGFAFAIYAVAVNWVAMPLRPDLFQKSWIGAPAIIAQMRVHPAPLYCIYVSLDNNILAYVPAPIRVVDLGDFAKVPTPAWAFITPEEAEKLRALRPDLSVTMRGVVHAGTAAKLCELRAK
jgi:hypothetical protein